VPGRLSNSPVMCKSLKSYDVSFICDHSICKRSPKDKLNMAEKQWRNCFEQSCLYSVTFIVSVQEIEMSVWIYEWNIYLLVKCDSFRSCFWILIYFNSWFQSFDGYKHVVLRCVFIIIRNSSRHSQQLFLLFNMAANGTMTLQHSANRIAGLSFLCVSFLILHGQNDGAHVMNILLEIVIIMT